MARRPALIEPFRVDKGTATRGTRVFVKELAAFLHQRTGQVCRFADKLGILYWAGRGGGHSAVPYVTEAGAKRLIAHFRAQQGGIYQRGIQFHEQADKEAAQMRRLKAHRLGILKQEKQAFEERKLLTLAISRAGTEDEAL